jgi:multidrug transporter EmrE-like cation transporter
MHPLILAVISIFFSVAAQFFLKAGMSSNAVKGASGHSSTVSYFITIFTNPSVILGFLLYGLGAVIWLLVLSKWDVSKAYPLVGFGFALSLLVGFMLGEQISPLRGFGVFLICCGVWLVAKS